MTVLRQPDVTISQKQADEDLVANCSEEQRHSLRRGCGCEGMRRLTFPEGC